MAIEQWLSNETKTPKPYVERGSIRDRPNAGGAGDLVRLLHAGRISTVNEGTPYRLVRATRKTRVPHPGIDL